MFKQLSAVQKQRLGKRREVIALYLSSEDVESKHVDTIMHLADLYGVLYSARPERGATAREIHRQAEAAALRQEKKTWRTLRDVAPDERKTRSAAAADAARKKVNAQLYQRVRGSAVIPHLADPQNRTKVFNGRRPEVEVTRFLQVGMRFLNENCGQAPDHSEECLAGVILRAEGKLQPSKRQVQKMKDRVHTRLMNAPILDDFDYRFAIGQEPSEEWVSMTLPISQQFPALADPIQTPRSSHSGGSEQ
jgi:hypothetical protein